MTRWHPHSVFLSIGLCHTRYEPGPGRLAELFCVGRRPAQTNSYSKYCHEATTVLPQYCHNATHNTAKILPGARQPQYCQNTAWCKATTILPKYCLVQGNHSTDMPRLCRHLYDCGNVSCKKEEKIDERLDTREAGLLVGYLASLHRSERPWRTRMLAPLRPLTHTGHPSTTCPTCHLVYNISVLTCQLCMLRDNTHQAPIDELPKTGQHMLTILVIMTESFLIYSSSCPSASCPRRRQHVSYFDMGFT